MPDPLARRSPDDVVDAPLFASPRDNQVPHRRGHRPIAETSRRAYRAHDRQSDRERVLQLLIERGPSTIEEVADAMGKPQSSVSGRFSQLEDLGLAERTDERRPTRSGASATVWRTRTGGSPTGGQTQ